MADRKKSNPSTEQRTRARSARKGKHTETRLLSEEQHDFNKVTKRHNRWSWLHLGLIALLGIIIAGVSWVLGR